MRGEIFTGIAALGVLLLGGCVKEARIAMPSDLSASTQRIELTGMGGWERGDFQLGASPGRFVRAAYQESDDGGFTVRDVGGGSFEVIGPDVDGALAANCTFQRAQRDMVAFTLTNDPFAYRCRFSRDRQPIDAGLILEAIPRSPGKLLSGVTRAGEVHIDGAVVTIHAIHDMEGGRIPSGTPLGYMFDVEGRRIGAVDLNGGTKTIFAPPAGPERQAVLAASLALSILWDPDE